MTVGKLRDFKRGWVIGDFEPNLFRTDLFEVGVLFHAQGEQWPAHYHKIATEYNILISGSMRIAGTEIQAGDYFVNEPGEIADPVFHEDCVVVCIKVPSVPGDKYLA
jgi:quercetin dioxygenase-like cupin family protein